MLVCAFIVIYVPKLIVNLPNYVTRYPEGVARLWCNLILVCWEKRMMESLASFFFLFPSPLSRTKSKWARFFFLFYLASMSDEIWVTTSPLAGTPFVLWEQGTFVSVSLSYNQYIFPLIILCKSLSCMSTTRYMPMRNIALSEKNCKIMSSYVAGFVLWC